ncbi:MAG: CYTH domain-containing protein [Neisseriaceae bacterium]|nr:CYTH domain-containing protein [Neisseriaceae bacterium]
MNIEIERRFLIHNDAWRGLGTFTLLQQGYLSVDPDRTVRVRTANNQGWLTLKSAISTVSRHEFEYEIPVAEAQAIMHNMCPLTVAKYRHLIEFGGFTFEVDEYLGENAPLIVAEIELPSEDTPFERPEWLGEEITHDPRYTNSHLSKNPYARWPEQQKPNK